MALEIFTRGTMLQRRKAQKSSKELYSGVSFGVFSHTLFALFQTWFSTNSTLSSIKQGTLRVPQKKISDRRLLKNSPIFVSFQTTHINERGTTFHALCLILLHPHLQRNIGNCIGWLVPWQSYHSVVKNWSWWILLYFEGFFTWTIVLLYDWQIFLCEEWRENFSNQI